MTFVKKNILGIAVCLAIAIPSFIIGKFLPLVGGPVIAILIGMILALPKWNRDKFNAGIKFTSKKILQYAVILLGFGMNLNVIMQTGLESLPIIISTILTSLLIAFALHKLLNVPSKISTLVGVGSSICGGSAIAATAPVINADDDEVAQAISVIFLFNIIAAIVFPWLGNILGFDTMSGNAFGIFAGTAVNDTSSVTATAATWDSMHNLGFQTLDKAVTVKLTRTLAIIPITLVLSFWQTRKSSAEGIEKVPLRKVFPFFILFFLGAALISTILVSVGVPNSFFTPFKELSKFFIILAMAAVGLNTNIVKLIKTGAKPLIIGLSCWVGITIVSLIMQRVLGLW
ncbi:MAG: YeiH family protein [Clostridia bacterium]